MVTSSVFGYAVVAVMPVPPVMGVKLPVTPPPPLTSFTGCRSRTLMSFLIRRQTDRITLIFGGCVSMPNYFVATFAFGWPTDPVVANILIPMPLLAETNKVYTDPRD